MCAGLRKVRTRLSGSSDTYTKYAVHKLECALKMLRYGKQIQAYSAQYRQVQVDFSAQQRDGVFAEPTVCAAKHTSQSVRGVP